MRLSLGSSCVSAPSARNGGPASTPRRPRSWCPLPASGTSSIRLASAKSAPGASIPTSWARAFRNSAPTSISAASTTAATSLSRAARCAARRPGRSIPTGCSRTSGSTRKSVSLPGPAAGVAGGDLGHHLRERIIEVDVLRVGDADDDEKDVRQLDRNPSGLFVGFLWFGTELEIDLACQLANLFGKSRHVRERREVPGFELAHPLIDGTLCLTKAHG